MTRISISASSHDNKIPGNKSYGLSFEGNFSEVVKEFDKIYEKFKVETITKKEDK